MTHAGKRRKKNKRAPDGGPSGALFAQRLGRRRRQPSANLLSATCAENRPNQFERHSTKGCVRATRETRFPNPRRRPRDVIGSDGPSPCARTDPANPACGLPNPPHCCLGGRLANADRGPVENRARDARDHNTQVATVDHGDYREGDYDQCVRRIIGIVHDERSPRRRRPSYHH